MNDIIVFMEQFNELLLHIICSGVLIIFGLAVIGCIIIGILNFFDIL